MQGGAYASRTALVVAMAVLLSGCLKSTQPPERLFAVAIELDMMRQSMGRLSEAYNSAFFTNPEAAKTIRNEIIAQRMYAIDVQYTVYENDLTQEGQGVGFGALTAAEGLSTAATLVAPVATKSILSAAATGVLAVKGHYGSEVLLAQTMRNIQKQMRASRNLVAATISARMIQTVTDYPLSAALSDTEDYYSAGTVTTGMLDISTTAGLREDEMKAVKQVVNQAKPSERKKVLEENTTEE